MSGIPELIDAVMNMQQNAQGNLPVIPNNGNPNGANNMPGGKYGAKPHVPNQPRPGGDPSWLAPSPAMEEIKRLLSGQNQPPGHVGIMPVPNQPVIPHQQVPANPQLPPMPGPVVPQMPRQGMNGQPTQPTNPILPTPRTPLRTY